MGQNPEKYPKCDVGAHQEEQIIRDFMMYNYHINSTKMRWLKDVIDIIDAHRRMFDFCEDLDSGIMWNVDTVEEGEGSATYTCRNEVNGVLQLVTDDADNDNVEVTRLCECWKLVDCYPLYAEIRMKVDEYLTSNFWFGLITGTSWFVAGPPDDCFVFENDGTDANLEINNRLNGAGNETLTGHTLVDDTWLRLGLHWDGTDTLRWFVIQDGDPPQTILFTGTITTHICQDEEFTIGFGVQNDGAETRNMYIDYLKICQKRVIE